MPVRRSADIWAVSVPNLKRGVEMFAVFTYDGTHENDEWWDVRLQAAPNVPRTEARARVYAHDFAPEWVHLFEPNALEWGRGDGLTIYLATALFAGWRGAKGLVAGRSLSAGAGRLWAKLVEHGLAKCEGEPIVGTYARPANACRLPTKAVRAAIEAWRSGRR